MKHLRRAASKLLAWSGALALASAAASPLVPHDFSTGNGSSPGGPGDPNGENGCPDGEGDGDPVMLFSGDFVEDRLDVHLPGRMLDVEVNFRYRSQSALNGPFGYGWDMSYHRRLRKLDNGDVVLSTGTNRTGDFPVIVPGSTYGKPIRFYGQLTENPNGTFLLKLPDGAHEDFDVNGNMTRRVDRNGNQLQFVYSPTPMPISGHSDYFVGQTSGVVAREYLLLAITDTIGRTISFQYDPSNHLSSIQWEGRSVIYGYAPSGSGDLVSVTYPATAQYPQGNTINYGYDAAHNLTSIMDAKGQTYLVNQYNASDKVTNQTFGSDPWIFVYGTDGGGNALTTVTDPRNVVTKYTFNTLGLTTKTEVLTDGIPAGEPSSYITTMQYDAQARLIREVAPRGTATEYSYSSSGKLLEQRRKKIGKPAFTPDPTDLVSSFTYEAQYDFAKTVTDPRGTTVTYTYDYELGEASHGNLRRITYPAIGGAIVTNITYDANGQVLSVTDPNGNVLRKTYDNATGYMLSITSGFGTPLAATTQYTYDTTGNVTAITDPNTHTATLQYDARDRVIKVTSPYQYVGNYRYDANGKLQQFDHQRTPAAPGPLPVLGTSSPSDDWESTVYTYDSRDRLTSVADDLGHATAYLYDGAGNMTRVTDANSHATNFQFDERSLMWKSIDARATPGIVETLQDPNQNLASLRDPDGNLTTYQYDDFDRPTRMTFADGSFEQYGYDANGNLTSRITPAGQSISYAYDALNRLTTKTTPSEATTYAYDLGSRLLEAADSDATIDFTYDALDRVATSITSIPGLPAYTNTYEYDRGGNRTHLHYPDGFDLQWSYDLQNRTTNVGSVVSYTYDALDQRTLLSRINRVATTYDFDAAGRNTRIRHRAPGGALEVVSYTYDATQNRTAHSDHFGAHAYSYDEIDQLTAATRPAGFPFANATYQYDLAGNRLTATGSVGAGAYAHNTLNQYTSVAGTPFAYDTNGNQTSDGARSYGYDAENRLTSASGAFGSASYAYDPLNRRVRKTVNGVTSYFLYDRADLIHETNAFGAITARYVHGVKLDEPLVLDKAGQRYFYVADALGSVIAITNSSGQLVERCAYDAYGQPSLTDASGTPIATSTVGNRFLFTGREYDGETGLVHERYRDYDPRSGRFLQRDPLGYVPDANLYRYVSNGPLAFIDPWGLSKGVGQPGFLESMIPVWGSARAAVDDFQNGRWGWGLFNTAMALTDLIPVKSLVGSVAKGVVWKVGSHTWGATRSWLGRRGFAEVGQEVHHWLIPRNQWGKVVPDWLKNQPWNLMPMPSRAWHNAIEGKGPNAMGLLGRLWHGSPAWARALGLGTAGDLLNQARDPDGEGCD